MKEWDEFCHEGFIVMFDYIDNQFYIVDYNPKYVFKDLKAGGSTVTTFSDLVKHWQKAYKRVSREVYLNE